jgi:zinc protease
VAQTLLGGGYSARLNQVIRIERGLSYGAFGGSEAHPAGGRWTSQAQTKHASAAEVARLMRDAVARLVREPAPAAELAARQASLVGGFARRLETTAGLASLVAGEIAAGRDPAALAGRIDAVRAVTPAQVQAYAARWWAPEALRVVIAGDWAAAGDSVKALGAADAVLRLPAAALDLDRPALRAP